jgi:hypothetical protein
MVVVLPPVKYSSSIAVCDHAICNTVMTANPNRSGRIVRVASTKEHIPPSISVPAPSNNALLGFVVFSSACLATRHPNPTCLPLSKSDGFSSPETYYQSYRLGSSKKSEVLKPECLVPTNSYYSSLQWTGSLRILQVQIHRFQR